MAIPNKTLNQLINLFIEWGNSHQAIHTVKYGYIDDLPKDCLYPLFFFQVQNCRITKNELYLNFDFLFVDNIDRSHTFVNEVHSDTLQLVNDLKSYIETSLNKKYVFIDEAQIELVEDSLNSDLVNGWKFSPSIRIPLLKNCEVPLVFNNPQITCDYPDYFITNSTGTLITSGSTSAGVDVNFELPDIDIINSEGDIIYENYPSVKDYEIPKVVIHTLDDSSEGFPYSGHIYTSFYTYNTGGTVNTRVRNSDGTFDQMFTASTVNLPSVNIYNSNSDLVFSGFPSVKDYTIPSFSIVDQSGYSATSVVYSATVHTNLFTPRIIYKRPSVNQKLSYVTGDLGWHVQNGSFNYSASTLYGIHQELDYDASNWFYTLKHNNAFGNKYRFTNSVGIPALDGGVGFTVGTYTSGGGLSYYAIDHLTGYGIYAPNISSATTMNWTVTMSHIHNNIRTTGFLGFTDWMPIFSTLALAMTPDVSDYYLVGSIFRSGIVTGYYEGAGFWCSDTRVWSTSSAYSILRSTRLNTVAKTSNYTSGYIVRVHY